LTAGRIRESFGERKTPSQLHAFGVSQLLAGRYDDAAQSLLAASREQPANAQYLSDVAAVQIERARLGLRPDDLPRALAAADRARRLDPSLKEAWFNRALAASALSLTAEAKGAWAEYLKHDSTSPWADEARNRLDELARPTRAAAWTSMEGRLQSAFDASTADEAVRTQTTEARNLIENTLLVNWANAVLNGESGDAELDRVRVMALAMQRVAGDAIYMDAVGAIDRATGASRVTLAGAHRDYAAAAAQFNQDAYASALKGFAATRAGFDNSSFAALAALHEAGITFITGHADEAERPLTASRNLARAKGYAYADARADWFLGLIAMGQGRLGEAQSRYEDALDTFTRMGDVEQAGSMHNLLAALHDYLGDPGAAWQHRLIAFEALSVSRSPVFKSLVLNSAVPSIRFDSPETALVVQEAALVAARDSGREAVIILILAQRASLLAALNRASEADASLRDARDHLARAPEQVRSRVEVAVLATESDLSRRSNPAAAVDAASQAIQIVQRRGERLRIAQLQLRLAQANIVWGRVEDARVALDRGLAAFNEERAASTELRPISALDESWQLFDASIQLSLKEKDYERAFLLSEAARARSASESKKFAPAGLATVQASLGANEAILALNQFDNELAVWVIKSNSVTVTMRSLSRQTSQQLIARQQQEIWQAATTTAAGRDLFNEIVRPVSQHLAGASRLIIVADPTFQDASFAAFYNASKNRFLVEDVSVRMAPSASAFAVAATATARGTIAEPLIFNGNGATDAEAIASAYGSSQRRSGADATRERFFADAADRRIVHVAAPTSVNPSYPLFSRLMVADEPGRRHSGVILGSDIAQRTLPRTGLVVIDESAAASSNRGEGTLGLARAFMTAGVPAVVGTLPGADENATRDLLIGFHREMSKGVSAEQALYTVQRNAIEQNGGRLGAWTALVLYGSDR